MAYIMYNGIAIPEPAYGSGGFQLSTLVDGGRNQLGNFIGQVIGDDKLKYEMVWPALTPQEVQELLAIFDRRQGGSFTGTWNLYDPALGQMRDVLMYVNDRTGRPFKVTPSTRMPELFLDVKLNLIEV